MQFFGSKPSVGVLYDGALGYRIDAALGLAVLYGLDAKNECRVVALSVPSNNLHAAGFTELLGRFYAGAVNGSFGAIGRTLPVGMATGKPVEDSPMLKAVLANPAYSHGIRHLNDTADPRAMLRNALTAQFDQNAVVVLAGPATNLAALLDLPGALPWVRDKVRLLALVPDASDRPALQKVLAEWPSPIVVVPDGSTFPGAAIDKDFAWSTAHPIVDAYRAAQLMPYDAPAAAIAAVLAAVRPDSGLFQFSAPGALTLSATGEVTLSATVGGTGRHRLLRLDPAQMEKLRTTYVELASMKPVPRAPRFRRPPAADAVKPPAAKPPAEPATPAPKP